MHKNELFLKSYRFKKANSQGKATCQHRRNLTVNDCFYLCNFDKHLLAPQYPVKLVKNTSSSKKKI